MSAPPVSTQPMTPPAVADWPVGVSRPPSNLPETDGEPLESNWHRDAINLLVELVRFLFLGRTDFFVGGNMFIYFSWEQVRNRDFRGPDLFFVKDVDGTRERLYWAIWEEGGRYPNLIIELLSQTTADVDRTTKRDLYERTFRTPEYFLYDPDTHQLEGWRLDAHMRYRVIEPNERGRMWSEQLGVWLGTWRGRFQGHLEHVWLRFFNERNELIPLFAEDATRQAREEKEHADQEKDRAEKAEAELARLKALLAEKGTVSPAEEKP